MAVDNKAIAEGVLAAVGGKDNIATAQHCMTRLRLTLADKSKIDEDAVKKVKGVLGAQWSGEQYQVIIGQNVNKVYDEFTAIADVAKVAAVDENLDTAEDAPKEKLTPKRAWDAVLGYLSRTMVQLIPLLITGGLFKALGTFAGPAMLGLVTEDSDFYVTATWVYNACFYFLPLYVGYAAAKTIGTNKILGMMLGGVLVTPTFTEMVSTLSAAQMTGETAKSTFYVLGFIPAPILDYSQSVLPILIAVAVMYLVEKYIKKVMPSVLTTVFTPFLTMLIMIPLTLAVIAPIGNTLGSLLNVLFTGLGQAGGIPAAIGMVLLGAFWQLLVVTGMHTVIVSLAYVQLFANGMDNFVLLSTDSAMLAVVGVALGAFLRLRNKDEKSLAAGYLVSGLVSGVTEPTLFGIILRFKGTILGMAAGGAVSALYKAITGVILYPSGGPGVLCVLAFLPGGTANMINGTIASALALIVAAVVTYFFGFSKEEMAAMETEDLEAA